MGKSKELLLLELLSENLRSSFLMKLLQLLTLRVSIMFKLQLINLSEKVDKQSLLLLIDFLQLETLIKSLSLNQEKWLRLVAMKN